MLRQYIVAFLSDNTLTWSGSICASALRRTFAAQLFLDTPCGLFNNRLKVCPSACEIDRDVLWQGHLKAGFHRSLDCKCTFGQDARSSSLYIPKSLVDLVLRRCSTLGELLLCHQLSVDHTHCDLYLSCPYGLKHMHA